MIKITFPDNSVREYPKGTTAMQIAESISSRLAQEVLAASVNGETWDLTRPIEEDASVKLLKWDDEEGKHAFWHSSAHLMAAFVVAPSVCHVPRPMQGIFTPFFRVKLSVMDFMRIAPLCLLPGACGVASNRRREAALVWFFSGGSSRCAYPAPGRRIRAYCGRSVQSRGF